MESLIPDPDQAIETELIARIQERLPELEALLEETGSHWMPGFCRFYKGSFKTYHLQGDTARIVAALGDLLPGSPLNPHFTQIISEGTGKKWEMAHNERWLEETRPILEAFFHARMMLQQIVTYGRTLESPTLQLRWGWAAVLCLYRLR